MEQTVLGLLNSLDGNLCAAIFTAMLLTGVGVPFPGELTLGFTGYLLYIGQIKWFSATTAAALGDLLGALIGYSIGFFSRSRLVTRYLGFLMPSASNLTAVNIWLEKYGIFAIVFGRLLPFIRGAIPVPAGFVHMNARKYILSNVFSSGIWCSALIYAGFSLGQNWQEIAGLGSKLGPVVAGGAVTVIVIWYLVGKKKNTP